MSVLFWNLVKLSYRPFNKQSHQWCSIELCLKKTLNTKADHCANSHHLFHIVLKIHVLLCVLYVAIFSILYSSVQRNLDLSTLAFSWCKCKLSRYRSSNCSLAAHALDSQFPFARKHLVWRLIPCKRVYTLWGIHDLWTRLTQIIYLHWAPWQGDWQVARNLTDKKRT